MLSHQGSLFRDAFSTSLPESESEVGSVHPGLPSPFTAPGTGRGGPVSRASEIVTSCTRKSTHGRALAAGILRLERGNGVGLTGGASVVCGSCVAIFAHCIITGTRGTRT